MRISKFLLLAAASLMAPTALAFAQTAPAVAPVNAEDARLTAFLDGEFAEEEKKRPTLATRRGIKENQDKLDDNSDAAALRLLEWRRASVAKMKAQFDRAKLSPDAQA